MSISRRELFRYAAIGSGAVWLSAVTAPGVAQGREVLGTIVDYSADVPSPQSIRAAGHIGAIRYVSDRRPGAEWMLAKPLTEDEATDLTDSGLEVVSCYQFGKADTADWRGGFDAGVEHATRGLELHRAAGGPDDRPIYASIDDNPTPLEFATLIAPYLLGWQSVVGRENTGVYANSPTIDLAVVAQLGSFYWQHDWGTPKGYVHPLANLHQIPGQKTIDGIGIDVNHVLTEDYGQWSLSAG
ncbi:DUF1906 domain-containing protein [Rhodococcus sp. HM1]|uniref:DUF1906 domain-containing protein n=1 Tax=Rhodococcus sp. HM1 TaxID=2937759 RepID=UPI00200B7F40|nr:DUF1906 domain-containing protein [Rhodococcus sp. HM1]MCK8671220.1 DUF1906 domain-containing protein [Rhodococcus sp. HM1]